VTYPYRTSSSSFQWAFPRFTGAVRGLIIACVAVYAVQIALAVIGPGSDLEPGLNDRFVSLFGLVPWLVLHGWVWQPVTYLFLHGDAFHILFNMLALWMFGTTLEQDWGSRRFLNYYFLTGIGAGILTFLVSIHSRTPTIGASGAIYGLLLAYGILHPNRLLLIWGIVPVKAKWLVLAFGVMELWSSWHSTGDGLAHIAHLGGMLFGLAYLKRVWRVRELYREIRWRLRRRRFQVIARDSGNGDPRGPFH
jgi:membrane associated rhomboid family serine protease